MKKTLMALWPKTRIGRVILGTLVVMIVAVVIEYHRAYAKVSRSWAYGRLAQMRVALLVYENDHGTLPPLCLRDKLGNPIQSWRALILPYCGGPEFWNQLNLSQPWNSDHNRRLIESVPVHDWTCFSRGRSPTTLPVATHILAYVGRESIWDAKTGLVKGKMMEHPDAIVLVSIPKSHRHPLEPGDITEAEVRKLVAEGQEVLFMTAHSQHTKYGIVTLERGALAFHRWNQIRDQKEGRH